MKKTGVGDLGSKQLREGASKAPLCLVLNVSRGREDNGYILRKTRRDAKAVSKLTGQHEGSRLFSGIVFREYEEGTAERSLDLLSRARTFSNEIHIEALEKLLTGSDRLSAEVARALLDQAAEGEPISHVLRIPHHRWEEWRASHPGMLPYATTADEYFALTSDLVWRTVGDYTERALRELAPEASILRGHYFRFDGENYKPSIIAFGDEKLLEAARNSQYFDNLRHSRAYDKAIKSTRRASKRVKRIA